MSQLRNHKDNQYNKKKKSQIKITILMHLFPKKVMWLGENDI